MAMLNNQMAIYTYTYLHITYIAMEAMAHGPCDVLPKPCDFP